MQAGNPTALVLAGGLGTRLRPVIDDQPKVLAEVAGHPFLKHLLDQLSSWKIEDVVLCTGYLGEQIESHFGDRYNGLRIRYSREPSPLGTGGALGFALPLVEAETLLIINGDSYFDTVLDPFRESHELRQAQASMLLVHQEDTRRFGVVEINEAGQVIRFAEKQESAGPGFINAGIYLIQRELLQNIPESKVVSLEQEIFPSWIGGKFYGFAASGSFLDIGTPESFAQAETFLARVLER